MCNLQTDHLKKPASEIRGQCYHNFCPLFPLLPFQTDFGGSMKPTFLFSIFLTKKTVPNLKIANNFAHTFANFAANNFPRI
jgi:hypothetical protein